MIIIGNETPILSLVFSTVNSDEKEFLSKTAAVAATTNYEVLKSQVLLSFLCTVQKRVHVVGLRLLSLAKPACKLTLASPWELRFYKGSHHS